MNFLFTTVLVLLIVAPGIFFSKTYFTREFDIKYSRLTITDQVFFALFPTILLHLVVITVGKLFNLFFVDFKILGVLLMGAKEDRTVAIAFNEIYANLEFIIIYQILICALASYCGWKFRNFVKKTKIDKKIPFFKYDNYWYYLVTGEILEFQDDTDNIVDASEIEFVILDVLVESKDKNLLYTGFFINYELAADGGLDCLYLKGAKRKFLNTKPKDGENDKSKNAFSLVNFFKKIYSNPEKNNEYYPIDGNILIIPYKEILNVNFTYYGKDEDENSSSQEPEEVQVNVVD